MPIALIVGLVAAFLFLRKPRDTLAQMQAEAGAGRAGDLPTDAELLAEFGEDPFLSNQDLNEQLQGVDLGFLSDPLDSPLDQEPEDLIREIGLTKDQAQESILFSQEIKPSFESESGVFDSPTEPVGSVLK